MSLNYEKTMSRILPIHPDAINPSWSEETLKYEAEKWCKPFFVVYHRCLDYKIRTQAQIDQCKQAPDFLDKCVSDVLSNMHSTIQKTRKK